MPHLYLRFNAAAEADEDGFAARLTWLARAEDGASREGEVTIAELPALVTEETPWATDPDNVTVFVPVAETLALTREVPGRNAAQLRRAAPYAVEEFIAEDIDTMHVACGALARGEPVRCLVTPRQRLEAWLACLATAGIEPGCLTADALALPADDPESVVVLLEDDQALVRAGTQVAAVDQVNLPQAVAAIVPESTSAERPRLRQFNGAMAPADAGAAGFLPDRVETVPLSGSVLEFLAAPERLRSAPPINLLQGDFAVQRRPGGAWTHWRPAAALAAIGLALTLALWGAEGVWANQRAATLREESRQIYKELFPDSRARGNPARLMRRRLGQTPMTADFHRLLVELGAALENGGFYELNSIAFADRSVLLVDMVVADYDMLEGLRDALRQRGLGFEVGSSEKEEQGRVRASLRIGGGSA